MRIAAAKHVKQLGLVLAALVTVALVTVAGGPAVAQDKPPILVRADECLKKNVDQVVAAEPDIQSAASFLVTYACAGEVSGASRYLRNQVVVGMFSGILKTVARPSADGAPPAPSPGLTATVDPETGDIVTPPPQPGAPSNPLKSLLPLFSGMTGGQFVPEVVPVSLRKLAGDLVLAARERQLAKSR